MNVYFHLMLCGVLILFLVGLSFYRKWIEDHQDHYIHLHDDEHDAGIVNSQSSAAKKLDVLDKAKNYLLAAIIIYAIAIVAIATYNAWQAAS